MYNCENFLKINPVLLNVKLMEICKVITNFCCYLLLCICCMKMLSIWCFLGNTILLLDLNSYFGIFWFVYFILFEIHDFIFYYFAHSFLLSWVLEAETGRNWVRVGCCWFWGWGGIFKTFCFFVVAFLLLLFCWSWTLKKSIIFFI